MNRKFIQPIKVIERQLRRIILFKINEFIPAKPEDTVSGIDYSSTKAKIVYIHPKARFYTIQFTFSNNSFCETRCFTETEKENARRKGMFKTVKNRATSSAKIVDNPCPPGYFMLDDPDLDEGLLLDELNDGYPEKQKRFAEEDDDVSIMF